MSRSYRMLPLAQLVPAPSPAAIRPRPMPRGRCGKTAPLRRCDSRLCRRSRPCGSTTRPAGLSARRGYLVGRTARLAAMVLRSSTPCFSTSSTI
jgi:hypothetical protein